MRIMQGGAEGDHQINLKEATISFSSLSPAATKPFWLDRENVQDPNSHVGFRRESLPTNSSSTKPATDLFEKLSPCEGPRHNLVLRISAQTLGGHPGTQASSAHSHTIQKIFASQVPSYVLVSWIQTY